MASTYSNLKFQLMTTGENTGTWGNVTNINLGTAIEEAITGSADVAFSSADVTLTLTDSNATQVARNLRLNLTGTSGGARNLVVPSIEKVYIVNNGLADAVTVKNATGTGISVPAGKTMWVFSDGTNVLNAVNAVTSLAVAGAATLGTPLAISSGGTGSNTGDASSLVNLNVSSASSGLLIPARGGTGVGTLTGYVYGNGTSAFTASTTIPGSAITGNISGNANTVTNGIYTTNIGSYAPTLTGGGASGTWGINITGQANALNSSNSYTVGGMQINGSAGVSNGGDGTNGGYFSLGNTNTSGGRTFRISSGSSADMQILNSAGTAVTQVFGDNGDITATGNVTAYSDARLKTDLTPIEGALDKIEQLTGYVYTRLDTGLRQTGLIAQDIEKVLPEAVQKEQEFLSVAYGNLMGLIVQGIKELRAEIASLRSAS